jgi:hypothetical protein
MADFLEMPDADDSNNEPTSVLPEPQVEEDALRYFVSNLYNLF